MIRLIDLLREAFEDSAFHGAKMTPQQMKTDTCSTIWHSPEDDSGCPQFSDSTTITSEDESKAVEYLNSENIRTLIAYSRGGAILLQALKKGAKLPSKISLVAPAWMRQWPSKELTGAEVKGANGYIIHGDLDNLVPLKHSAILAKASKLPLYVVKGANHINILKYKLSPAGIRIKDLDAAIKALPDWGETGQASEDELRQQQDWVASLTK